MPTALPLQYSISISNCGEIRLRGPRRFEFGLKLDEKSLFLLYGGGLDSA
jgi:hypothetical protein